MTYGGRRVNGGKIYSKDPARQATDRGFFAARFIHEPAQHVVLVWIR